MNKAGWVIALTIWMVCMMGSVVHASDVVIDKSNAANGLISVKYTGDLSKAVLVSVEKDSIKYVYYVKSKNANNVPLQMGSGNYKISILQQVSGSTYKPVASESVTVDKINELEMYKGSTFLVDYNVATKAVAAYKQLTSDKKGNEAVGMVYNDVVNNYSYDYDKAKNIKNDYVPVIDEMYTKKKGICYDYASLMAGALRSQSVPTKLVMGYAPEISTYHAWNEIYIDEKWVVVDTTYDSTAKSAGVKYTMAKDASKFKVVKVY